MTRRQEPTRRAFLGKAAEAAGAVTASAVAGGAITGAISGCTGSAGAHPAPRNTKIGQQTSKAENSLPGERAAWRAGHALRLDDRPRVPGERAANGLVRRLPRPAGLALGLAART